MLSFLRHLLPRHAIDIPLLPLRQRYVAAYARAALRVHTARKRCGKACVSVSLIIDAAD